MSNFHRPLQIYLDTQDYSNLSRAMDSASHPQRPVFDHLLKYVEQDLIEIRFSAVHVIESAHLDSSSLDLALGRARCIEVLTRGKCLKCWSDSIQAECSNVVHGRAATEGITNDNSIWFPDLSEIALGFRKMLIEQFKEIMRGASIPRSQRRLLQKKVGIGDRLHPAIVEMFSDGRGHLLKSIAEQFPFGDRFFEEDLMLKYATGQIGPEVIVEEMSVVLRDLNTFLSWTYEKQDKNRDFVSWLRSGGASMAENISRLRSRLEAIRAPLYQLGIDRKEIDIKMRNIYNNTIHDNIQFGRLSYIKDIRKKMRSNPHFLRGGSNAWEELEVSPIGTLPMLDSYILAMGEHVRRSVLMDRRLKDSDSADLYHLACLPYVDLFRADGDTSEVGRPIAKLFGKKIVSKLAHLPSEIEAALSGR